MYEGASSLAEAALMACRVTGREEICVLNTVSPTYREVVETYALPQGLKVTTMDAVRPRLPEGAACLLTQYPNFYGYIEDLAAHKVAAQETGRSAGGFDGPSGHGNVPSAGRVRRGHGHGRGAGIGRADELRRTLHRPFRHPQEVPAADARSNRGADGGLGGKDGIRADAPDAGAAHPAGTGRRATSAPARRLLALASAIATAALGKQGLPKIAELSYHKAHYAASLIGRVAGYSFPIRGTFFKEFVVKCPASPSSHQRAAPKERDYRRAGHQPRNAELHVVLRH